MNSEMNNYFCFICLVWAITLEGETISSTHIVETKLGKVKGNEILLENGREVREYLGIRYGQPIGPPIGQLRFRKPLPVVAWNETWDATHEKFSCMQDMENISEDCLFLNIWQPKQNDNREEKKIPIMIWIFGGDYVSGSIYEVDIMQTI
jgi:carboxylesterase type B